MHPIVVLLQAQKVLAGIQISVNRKAFRGTQPAGFPERLTGEVKRWANKAKAVLLIKWTGSITGSHESLLADSGLLRSEVDCKIEPFADGSPAPVAPLAAGDDLVATTNLQDTAVLQSMAGNITTNSMMYFQDRIMTQRAQDVTRLAAVKVLMPLYAKANLVTLASVEKLRAFRFCEHPRIKPFVVKIMNEVGAYNTALARCMPSSLRLSVSMP